MINIFYNILMPKSFRFIFSHFVHCRNHEWLPLVYSLHILSLLVTIHQSILNLRYTPFTVLPFWLPFKIPDYTKYNPFHYIHVEFVFKSHILNIGSINM